jgi:hypothetical protein
MYNRVVKKVLVGALYFVYDISKGRKVSWRNHIHIMSTVWYTYGIV